MHRLVLIAIILPGLLLQPLALADGRTDAMFSSFQASIETLKGKIRGEDIRHTWSTDGKFLHTEIWNAESEEFQSYSYDLATGEQKLAEKNLTGEKSKKIELNLSHSPTRQSASSPDKRWQTGVSDGAIVLTPKEGPAQPQNFKLPEGSQWQKKFHWAPNSSACVAWHVTSHPVRKVHYVRSSPEKGIQPEQFSIDYPKPGDLLNIARPVIFFTDGRPPMELDAKLSENPFEIRKLRWHPDSKSLTVEFIQRGFGEFSIIEMDVSNRTQRALLTETSETFVYVYGNCFYHELANGDEALWLSQRSGYNHLYLIDRKTGKPIRPLTGGQGLVREIVAVDEKARTVTASVAGIYPGQDHYFLHYIRIGMDDGKITRLTEANGTHEIFLQPAGNAYIAKWSRVDHPPVHEIRRLSDGELIATLPSADLTELKKSGWIAPEPFVAKDRNGKFDIHGVIIRPIGFDPSKKYPVVEQIYAGPHGFFVPKSWQVWHGAKSEIAESGFITVQIDGLGTNHRGKEFHDVSYKNLIDSGFPDRIRWIKAAAEKHPQLDLSRVGIFGGSAGGQSTLAALLTHPDFYKVGVADCGCHDNRMDKIWWNEQWMDWPVDESYAANSNVTHAAKLQGALLLTVGELDTNVDPSSTYQVADALIKADKDFDYLVVPGANHGVGDSSKHLRRKRIEFFQKHLLVEAPEK